MAQPNRSGLPKSHPDYWKNLRYRQRYGVGIGYLHAKLAEQGGRCSICQVSDPGGKGWHLDHCHRTGGPRGILCLTCNMALGYFKDSPAYLKAATAYLISHGATDV